MMYLHPLPLRYGGHVEEMVKILVEGGALVDQPDHMGFITR
jgi:hypothetical protein